MRARFRSAALSLVTSPHLSADQVSQIGLRCLRRIAVLLALCVAWSFALGPAALAAKAPGEAGARGTVARPQAPSIVQIWRDAQEQQRRAERDAAVPRLSMNPPPVAPRPPVVGASATLPFPVTLLDEVGHLLRPVPAAQVAAWRRELGTGHSSGRRAALLHLWLGEYAVAHDQHPRLAQEQLRQAQSLTVPADPLYHLCAYDRAVALDYAGAYDEATAAFRHLLAVRNSAHGYNRERCALWLRHVSACAGYHAAHARLGIPEPPRLDPECGAAALAACLRSLGRPYDKRTVLASCRVTGEGSTLQDVLDAGHRLGLSARAVRADDRGLIALPKPLVAYVEQDHFVALIRADRRGVSYLCSDCGMWPGGRVDLTWKQWHTMSPGLYAAVTPVHGSWDGTLAELLAPPASPAAGVRVATAGPMAGLLPAPRRVGPLLPSLPLLRGHVYRPGTVTGGVHCGSSPTALKCPPDAHPCLDCGPKHDPVNLGNGEEEYAAPADLVVYNPHGPSVTWGRSYENLRGPGRVYLYPYYAANDPYFDPTYQSDDFGVGWSQPYNVGVIDTVGSYTAGTRTVVFDNGGRIDFTGTGVPTAGHPVVYAAARTGVPMLLEWDYDTATAYHFAVIFKDRTRWVTQSLAASGAAPGSVWPLAQITDRNGNSIYFNYTTSSVSYASYGWPLLGSITTGGGGTGTALLTVTRATDGSGNVVSVSDPYGRSVYYQDGTYSNINIPSSYPTYYQEVSAASQVVPTGTSSPPMRWGYGYEAVPNGEGSEEVNYLHTISEPSATGGGTSTAYLWYMNDPSGDNPNYVLSAPFAFVGAVVDANGNQRLYSSSYPSNASAVTVKNSGGSTVYSYSVTYDGNLNELSRTDGAGHAISSTTYQSGTYLPGSVTDGNGYTWSYTYDQYGNLTSETPPVSGARTPATTNYTYPLGSYSIFPMGELTGTQVGAKTGTSYTYSEPSGLVATVTGPQPGTVGGMPGAAAIVLAAYTYDALGNVTSIKAPGPNSTPAATTSSPGFGSYVTTNLFYTSDAAYSTTDGVNYGARNITTNPDAIGEPLAVTDPLGHTTHFRYLETVPYSGTAINRGHAVSVTDAGNSITAGAPGDETQMAYNIDDRPLSTLYPKTGQSGSGHGRTVSQYLYDESGDTGGYEQYGPLQDAQTFDEGNTSGALRQVNYAYGPEGETLGVSGSTEPVTYAYDALYRLSSLTDGGGHATSYFYNAAGYLYQTAYPLSGATSSPLSAGSYDTVTYTAYDGEGNVTARVDGNGTNTAYTYADPESLLTNVHYTLPATRPAWVPAGAVTPLADTALHYDAYGRRDQMSDGASGTHNADGTVTRNADGTLPGPGQTYTYDDGDATLTRAFAYTGLPTKTLTYGYDPDGSRLSMALSGVGGSFSYTYDNAGRETGLTNPYGQATAWAYLNNDWLASRSVAHGGITGSISAAYTYNQRGQVADLKNVAGGSTPSTVSEFTMSATGSYDGAGNRTSMNATGSYPGATSYAYDGRDELTQEASSRTGAAYTDVQHYDGVTSGTTTGPGNPTTMRGGAHTYNADNQGVLPTWDGNGSPVSYVNACSYDPECRQTSDGGQTNTYNGDGLRAKKSWGGYAAYYFYDGDEPVAEADATGAVNALHTWGADGLVSRRFQTTDTFYLWDPSGNCAARLTSAGAVSNSYAVDGFGATAAGGVGDPYSGFGGQWGAYTDNGGAGQDGLTLLGHRVYDPGTGRFLTRDPMGYGGGINLYGYTQNDPVNRSDPSGHFAPPIFAAPVLGIPGVGEVVGIVIVVIGVSAGIYCLTHPGACRLPTLGPPPTMAPPITAPPPASCPINQTHGEDNPDPDEPIPMPGPVWPKPVFPEPNPDKYDPTLPTYPGPGTPRVIPVPPESDPFAPPNRPWRNMGNLMW